LTTVYVAKAPRSAAAAMIEARRRRRRLPTLPQFDRVAAAPAATAYSAEISHQYAG
jgi:hypothetical protein